MMLLLGMTLSHVLPGEGCSLAGRLNFLFLWQQVPSLLSTVYDLSCVALGVWIMGVWIMVATVPLVLLRVNMNIKLLLHR